MDIRNQLDIPLCRAKGGFLEKVPEEIWDNPAWVLEPKLDGIRISVQLGREPIVVGKNRQATEGKQDKVGSFRNLAYLNPGLFRQFAIPDLDGTLLDGELMTDRVFVWDILRDRDQDVCMEVDQLRRERLTSIVSKINRSCLAIVPRVAATKSNLSSFLTGGQEGAVAKYLYDCYPDTPTHPTWYKIKSDHRRTIDGFVSSIGPKSAVVSMMGQDGPVVVAKVPGIVCQPGRVVELRVSGWNGKSFRTPKFVRFRPDKTPADCRLAEQIGR